jgi:hypothetical protein
VTPLKRALASADTALRNALTWDQYQSYFNYMGSSYPLVGSTGTLSGPKEEIKQDFEGYVIGAYKGNGVVAACLDARLRLFSQARFQFRRMHHGRPGDLYGTEALAPLETPWVNANTSDLLKRMVQDADLAGNFFGHRPGRVQNVSNPRARNSGEPVIRRLRPDWMTIVLGSKMDPKGDPSHALDCEVAGYLFHPGGHGAGDAIVLPPDEVAHFAPKPDPIAHFRGMSLITSVIRDIMGDGAATSHKLKYYEQGATPNLVVMGDPSIKNQEAFDVWIAKLGQKLPGLANAYKTLYLAYGADAKVLGSNLKEADIRVVQAAGETRIAAAMGVPPIIAGLSEGLAAATYSNYGQARRAFADLAARPWWQDAAGSLATLIDLPPSTKKDGTAELWYDDRDIPFLAEDVQDAADVQQKNADTIHTLVIAGFTPDSAVKAVLSGDYTGLEHSGMYSVQLVPAGAVAEGKGALVQGTPTSTGNDTGKSTPPAKGAKAFDGTHTGRVLRALLDK